MDDKVYEAARWSTAEGIADIPSDELSRLTPGGQSNVLHVAAQHGNHNFISALVARGICLVHELLCKQNTNQETPLHLAAQSGSKKTVKVLLSAHDTGDQNNNLSDCWGKQDKDGDTPLHKALRYGHEDIALLLSKRDVQLVFLDNNVGESPAYLAAQNFCLEFLRKVLDYDRHNKCNHKCDNKCSNFYSKCNHKCNKNCSVSFSGPFGQTVFHPARKLSGTLMSLLVESRKQLLKIKDNKGKTVLAYAVEENRESMVETLLKADSTLAYLHDNDGFTPLHKAASLGSFPMVQTILDSSPQSITIRDERQSKTALHVAKMEASFLEGCVKKTRMRELINEVDIDGNTALHLALMKSDFWSANALLQANGINWRLTNKEGLTPMDLCKSTDKIPVTMKCLASASERRVKDDVINMEIFYAKEVTNVDDLLAHDDWQECLTYRSPNGDTILHIAARDGCIKTIRKAKESNSCHQLLLRDLNSKGETPLHLAAEHGELEVVKAITSLKPQQNDEYNFEHGNPNQREVSMPWRIKSRNGDTPAHKALRNGHGDIASHILKSDPGLLTFVNNENESLLYLAAENLGYEDRNYIVSMFGSLNHVSICGPNGENPLHAAARNRGRFFLQYLIKRRPDLMKLKDHSGKTPLHHAVENERVVLVKSLLLGDKAAAFMYDNEGFTPLLRAAAMGFNDCINMILRHCPHSAEFRDLSKNRTVLHLAKLSSLNFSQNVKQIWGKWINEIDEDGNTPLHSAVINADQPNTLALLDARGINWKIRNKQHQMPLDLCNEQLLKSDNKSDNKDQRDISNVLKRLKCGKLSILQLLVSGLSIFTNIIDGREIELTEDKKVEKLFNNVALVAALLVTISFAALLTIPGGYNQDNGHGIRMKEAVLKAFVFLNAFSLVTGFGVLLKYVGAILSPPRKKTGKRMLLRQAIVMLNFSLWAASAAFLCGVYAIAAPAAIWIFVFSVLFSNTPWFDAVFICTWQSPFKCVYLFGRYCCATFHGLRSPTV